MENAPTTANATLDTIIGEYAAAQPSYELLRVWISRYPQYEQELTDFTASLTLIAPVAPDPVVAPLNAARRLALVNSVLDTYAPAALKGILSAAREQGLSRKQLAASLDLSIPLVEKLDRRLISFASLPGQIVSALAATLNVARAQVETYLQGAPLLPVGASYRADEAPALPEQQTFAEAVQADKSLSVARKAQLLKQD